MRRIHNSLELSNADKGTEPASFLASRVILGGVYSCLVGHKMGPGTNFGPGFLHVSSVIDFSQRHLLLQV